MPSRRPVRVIGCLGAALALVVGAGAGSAFYAAGRGWIAPLPVQERCDVRGTGGTVVLTPEQARLTSIIVGRSVARGLSPRAATIAMATAYQESGIRNLDHGDLDSLGLFQQRPSKGWGTPEQIRDPWYATDRFYDALVRIPGWETADINDTAQQVQRSGHPQAYRKHEPNARVLAEVFTGQTWTALSCAVTPGEADPAAHLAHLSRTFGDPQLTAAGATIRVRARSPQQAWAIAYASVASARAHGIAGVATNHLAWRAARLSPAAWSRGDDAGERDVVVSLR